MRKYLLHVLIISFVFLLAPAAHVASYAGETYEEYSKRIEKERAKERAIDNAKEEVRKYPDEAWAHGLLGVAHYETGKHEEAIESYKQAIRIDPDYAKAHNNLGVAHTRKEDKGESTGSIWVTNQEQQYGPRTQSGAGCDGM